MAGSGIENEQKRQSVENATHILHPIYSCLEKKHLLVLDTIYTTIHIEEETKALQKMRVTTAETRPMIDGQQVSLDQFIETKNVDILVIHPWNDVLPEIKIVIDKNTKPVILITDENSVNEECKHAIQQWGELGIPTISKNNLSSLPMQLTKTMATMIDQQSNRNINLT